MPVGLSMTVYVTQAYKLGNPFQEATNYGESFSLLLVSYIFTLALSLVQQSPSTFFHTNTQSSALFHRPHGSAQRYRYYSRTSQRGCAKGSVRSEVFVSRG